MLKKRGLPIPLKSVIIAILILVQFCLVVFPLIYLWKSALWFYELCGVIGAVFSIYIISREGNPSYKMAWVVLILLFPILGICVFLLFGGGRVFPHLKRKMAKCEKEYFSKLKTDDSEKEKLFSSDLFHARQADYLSRETGLPIYSGTKIEYLESGESFFDHLLFELKSAEKYIFIEFFILADGFMWDSIKEILVQKAKNGVEVRIIFDDFGSIGRQGKNFVKELKNSGIKVSVFNPLRPSVDIFMNNRNHRKIVIIDGITTFTGGINIGDEYINRLPRFGHWQDCGIMLKGRATDSFVAMFFSMWEFTTGEKTKIENYFAGVSFEDDGHILPYCDDPLNGKNPAEGIYMQIINTAQNYVYIMSPYLILDSNMKSALKLAAKSGIDVRIITPSHPDKWYVHPVTQQSYGELLSSGVKIYEYTPGFIHSKVFLSDDKIATIGSVNMDYRSFYFHFECGVWESGSCCNSAIKNQFNELFEKSKEITEKEWKNRPLFQKIKQMVLHIFSPFM